MDEPPVLAGAVHRRVTDRSPGVRVPRVGAPGTTALLTAAVAADCTRSAVPWSSVKVTTTRSVRPASARVGVNDAAVAPAMLLKTPALPLCHWNLNVALASPSASV